MSAAGSHFSAAYRFGSEIGRGKGKGHPRVLIVLDALDRALLDQVRPVVGEGRREGIRVRLDTADNLVRGADAFPAFSLELIRHRTLLAGDDVLAELTVQTADLRLHVEHGLRGIFRDLVAAYVADKIHGDSLLDIRRTTRRLLFLLEGALLARGAEVTDDPTPEEIIAKTREKLRDDPDAPWATFERFLNGDLKLDTSGMRELYGALLAILERVIDYVDRL